jgi:phasin family protein
LFQWKKVTSECVSIPILSSPAALEPKLPKAAFVEQMPDCLSNSVTQESEMPHTAEQFVDTNKANVEALQGMMTHALAGFQRLAELNLAVSMASMVDSFNAVLGAKDAQQLLGLQAGLFNPLAMRYVSYGSHVYTIATETGAEFIKALTAVVENVERNAPGVEPAVTVLKNAVSVYQKAIETAQDTAKKAVELAESNLAAAANHADHPATTASKKR